MVLRIVSCLYFCVFINSFLNVPITNANSLSSYVRYNLTRVKRQGSNCNGFQCMTSNECILERQKCDGIIDCRDGSDEFRNCIRTNAGCILPRKPFNGNWFFPLNKSLIRRPGEIVDEGTLLKFQCYPGYKLNQENSLIACLQDGWDKDPPLCFRICPTLSSNEYTQVSCFSRSGTEIQCSEAADGSYARFECAPYYEASDIRIRRYCVGGEWDLLPPQCLPVCGEKRVTVGLLAVNGTDVIQGDYPWVTAVYERNDVTDEFLFICGGSMLTQKVILTAAHCVTNLYGDPESPSYYRIAVGKYYKDYGDPRDRAAQYASVQAVVVNPKYRGDSQRHASDIALLITKEKLIFSRAVQPVCYRNLYSITLRPNELGTVAGWGYTTAIGSPASTLQEITIPYKDNAACSRELTSDWTDRYLTYDKFCAGYANKSIAVCQGDSGSGLVFKNRNRYYVHGIVSLTKEENGKCDIQVSGLYTRVSDHYDWLESAIASYSVQSTSECTSYESDQCINSSESCVLPNQIENGKWYIFTNWTLKLNPGEKVVTSTLLKFVCNSGYVLSEDNAYMICLQEGWNKESPSCVANRCPSLSFDDNTRVTCFDKDDKKINCSKVENGSYAKYECIPGYQSSDGYDRISCMNAKWNLPPPRCVPVSGQENFKCPDDYGFYPHHISCDKYWKCDNNTAELKTCGNGLAFNASDSNFLTEDCDYIHKIDCGNRSQLDPPISTTHCHRLYGIFPDDAKCDVFWNCWNGEASRYQCSPGLAYDREDRVCRWADQIPECKNEEIAGGFSCPAAAAELNTTLSRYAHPEDCRKYYICLIGKAREYSCPIRTVFKIGDADGTGNCEDPEGVPGCEDYYGDLDLTSIRKNDLQAGLQSSGSSNSSSSRSNSDAAPEKPSQHLVAPPGSNSSSSGSNSAAAPEKPSQHLLAPPGSSNN